MIKRAGLTVGFTLIEMAIVLVVIGLILSGGLLAVAPVLQKSKTTDTYSRMDRIEQALIVYAIRNSCLPCPAKPDANSGTSADNPGQADAGGPYTSGCKAAVCTYNQGSVPWVTLGLTEADATDGFGSRIDYALTSDTTGPNNLQQSTGFERSTSGGSTTSYPEGTIRVNNAAGADTTGATNEVTGGASPGIRAAYVLISHGADRSFGYAASTGTRAGDPNGSDAQLANSNGAPFAQNDPIDISGTTYFDDIVRWRSAPMVIQQCGSGACGNPE